MRKLFLVIAAIAFAAMTTTADAAKKSKKVARAQPAQATSQDAYLASYYDNTGRFMRDALPLVLPTWSLPFYMGMQPEGSTHGPKAAKRGKAGKQAKQ
jgi:hypothetical protein